MEPVITAQVAVDKTALPFDKAYSYAVPQELRASLRPGCRVLVPFGGGNAKRQGIVLSLGEEEGGRQLKAVTLQVDGEPLLTPELMALVKWMRAYFFCTYYDAVRQILPPGAGVEAVTLYRPAPREEPPEGLSPDELAAYRAVCAAKGKATERGISKALGMKAAPHLASLLDRQLVLAVETARQGVSDETVTVAALAEDFPQAAERLRRGLTPAWQRVVSLLREAGALPLKELCAFAPATPGVVKTMEKNGLLTLTQDVVCRSPYRQLAGGAPPEEPELSPAQEKVYQEISGDFNRGKAMVGLLYGVTGSGKTVVFLKLIHDAVEQGRGVILLVPEIGLTPQMVSRFRRQFGEKVAVIHSGLSQGERLDEFRRIRAGEARIVVGTRSAVFAPVENLGLIIMDEEQEQTYKSEASPRFHARDVAKFRCVQRECLLLLASATPSLDSYYHARQGDYRYYELLERFGPHSLPQVELIDLRRQLVQPGSAVFSARLIEELQRTLERGEQSILLLNRRGFHTVVACAQCGEPLTCPNCSVSLTYHQVGGQMMCHYCGYSQPLPQACPSCGSELMRCAGFGTQKCEEELHRLFPSARVLRMDQDTTVTKDAHERYFLQFSRGDYDILVGTQMVAKGLDFPRVTLVGVLAGDQMLYSGSYRGYERAFSLLTQVVGRCGRAQLQGRAFIQTHTPENPVYALAVAQDYPRFYAEEIESRRFMSYPPFCDVCTVGFSGVYEDQVVGGGVDFINALRRLASQEPFSALPMKVFGPVSWDVVKVNNKYRYKIMIKYKNSKHFRVFIRLLLEEFGKDPKHKKVNAFADFHFE